MAQVEFLNYDVLDEKGWSVGDEDLFEKARDENLSDEDHDIMEVDDDESILIAAEDKGYDWPYGCRHGMCASCASVLVDGEIDMPNQQVLSDDQVDDGVRVTCIGTPGTEEVKIVYNAKQSI